MCTDCLGSFLAPVVELPNPNTTASWSAAFVHERGPPVRRVGTFETPFLVPSLLALRGMYFSCPRTAFPAPCQATAEAIFLSTHSRTALAGIFTVRPTLTVGSSPRAGIRRTVRTDRPPSCRAVSDRLHSRVSELILVNRTPRGPTPSFARGRQRLRFFASPLSVLRGSKAAFEARGGDPPSMVCTCQH